MLKSDKTTSEGWLITWAVCVCEWMTLDDTTRQCHHVDEGHRGDGAPEQLGLHVHRVTHEQTARAAPRDGQLLGLGPTGGHGGVYSHHPHNFAP